jgi:ectoine hydroxylase-related dioxygenase (phytanoyl-CoA dioxygenase family)
MGPTRGTTTAARTTPLDGDELWRFYEAGYLRLGTVIDEDQVAALREMIARVRAAETAAGGETDLLDPATWPEAEGGVPQEPGRVSFLFNLWRSEPEQRALVFDPRFAHWAAQALGALQVRVLEDNALSKDPHTGGALRWHQDYAYWPLGQPNAVTIWVALDEVTADNGAMRMAVGSHLLGERLPAVFGTGAVYFRDRRPAVVGAIADADLDALDVDVLELAPGEATLHHSLTWHASGPNSTDRARRAAVARYVADGTTWFGARRYEFNYSDEELGLAIGDRIGGPYFPLVEQASLGTSGSLR